MDEPGIQNLDTQTTKTFFFFYFYVETPIQGDITTYFSSYSS